MFDWFSHIARYTERVLLFWRGIFGLSPEKDDPVSQQGHLWVLWADWDWVAARILYLQKNPKLWPSAGLLGQKALEQYLKALLRSHGVKTEWRGERGHKLIRLAQHCARYEDLFKNATLLHRFQIFYDIYRGWRYPSSAKGEPLSGEVNCMGDNHLTELDETVALVRPRIQLHKLGLPQTFRECHNALPEGPSFIQWAEKENNSFSGM